MHYSRVLDSDSELDNLTLRATLLDELPDYEELIILEACKATEIMQSGTDGAILPIFKIPMMIGKSDLPPEELEYA